MKKFGLADGGKRQSFKGGAIREPATGKGRFALVSPFALRRMAAIYEKGEVKYQDGRNWEKGIPFSRFLDSAERHIQQYKMGLEDEDHLGQAAWNLFCMMHFEELGRTDLDDLPHYLRKERKA